MPTPTRMVPHQGWLLPRKGLGCQLRVRPEPAQDLDGCSPEQMQIGMRITGPQDWLQGMRLPQTQNQSEEVANQACIS
jgi:hypothetical protein